MFIVCDIVAIDARKIYSFPRKGQFNKSGNFSIHMKDRENLTLSKKSDGGDIYIYIYIYIYFCIFSEVKHVPLPEYCFKK